MSNTIPFFSIVIPVYNTQEELKRCIDGILCQSFTSYEVVLVDDGSTDNSGKLCDQYAEMYQFIRCIHKPNGGAPDARNVGMKNAKGNYLMFLDSDDTWTDPNALQDIYNIIEKHPGTDLVCFGTEIVDEHGKLEKIRKPILPDYAEGNRMQTLQHLIYTNQYFSASYVKVIKRALVEADDLYFNTGYLSGEDIEWCGRILLSCQNIRIYSSSFYQRIKRASGAITSSIGKKNILDIIRGIQEGVSYIDEHESDKEKRLVYYEYWSYQYAMLFVLLHKVANDPDYSTMINAMKKYKWLLQYDHQKKVKLVRILVTFLGVKNTVTLLSVYYDRK